MAAKGEPGSAPVRVLFKALGVLNVAGALLVVMLLVLINMDSLGRTLFSISILGVTEVVEMSLVAIVFLQLGDAVRARKLTRSEGLLTILGERVPTVSRSLRAFFDLVSVAFLTLVVVGGIPRFIESYERGEFKGTAQLFTVAGVAGEAHDRRRLDRRDSRVSRFGLAGVAARRARLMAAPVRLTRAA